ncbi:unnamed protein product [Paramecium sonneborni]|uniref:Proliferating cell nuclear antigen PCNA C-terminal domain-containing protein n=1 Tax=Paramecium sonneborni TaxID=65129 RepID=A0A8S1RL07_9CILI|nr:unnamed protein product [Paramecium sonneborni]
MSENFLFVQIRRESRVQYQRTSQFLQVFNQFNIASAFFNSVTLFMSQELPLIVENLIEEIGTLRLYLASKINDQQSQ